MPKIEKDVCEIVPRNEDVYEIVPKTEEGLCDFTLPIGLELRHSKLPSASMGVFTLMQINSNVHYGPYIGERLELYEEQRAFRSEHCWLVNS